jgi:hypothetical protein
MGLRVSTRRLKEKSKKEVTFSKKEVILHDLEEMTLLLREIDESIQEIVFLRELDYLEKQMLDMKINVYPRICNHLDTNLR